MKWVLSSQALHLKDSKLNKHWGHLSKEIDNGPHSQRWNELAEFLKDWMSFYSVSTKNVQFHLIILHLNYFIIMPGFHWYTKTPRSFFLWSGHQKQVKSKTFSIPCCPAQNNHGQRIFHHNTELSVASALF